MTSILASDCLRQSKIAVYCSFEVVRLIHELNHIFFPSADGGLTDSPYHAARHHALDEYNLLTAVHA